MAIANIEELCKGLCEAAGAAAPTLRPDGQGMRAATIRIAGTEILVRQFADRSPDCVFFTACLGDPPEGRSEETWRVLMDANLHLAGELTPTYSRDPATQRAALHWGCPLMAATVPAVLRRLASLAEAAKLFRAGAFLEDPASAHRCLVKDTAPEGVPHARACEARADFDALHRDTCALVGQSAPGEPAPANGVRGFTIAHEGVSLSVVQSIEEDPDSIFLVVRLGRPQAGSEADDIAALLELNHHLATESRRARASREQESGDLLLVYVLPLPDAAPEGLLVTALMLAGVARQWRFGSRTRKNATQALHGEFHV